MLSLPKLTVLAQNDQHDRLIDAVLRSGRSLPDAVRSRLADPRNAPMAGLALAVQRSLELTAGRPTEPIRDLLGMLLDRVEAASCEPDQLPAMVIAAAALAEAEAVFRNAMARRPAPAPAEPAVDEDVALVARAAAARVLLWMAIALAQNLDPDEPMPLGAVADAETTFLVLWLLDRVPEACELLHVPLLIDAAMQLGLANDPRIAAVIGQCVAAAAGHSNIPAALATGGPAGRSRTAGRVAVGPAAA